MEYPYGHHHHRGDEEDDYPPPPRHHHHDDHHHPHHHHHQNEYPPPPPPPEYRDQPPYPAEIHHSHHYNTLPPGPPQQPNFSYPPPGYSSVQHVSHEFDYQRFEPNPSEFHHEAHHHQHHPDHHHHHHRPEVPTIIHHHSHEGVSELFNRPTFRVFCKANTDCSLAIRNGQVVLARYNPDDVFQHWIKDERYSIMVKDEQDFPSFALVNKGTGQAMKHSIGARHPVQLRHYNENELDESVLWSESVDLGDGFRTIRMVNNIRLNLDAFRGDKNHGAVHDGTIIGLWEWTKGDNQRWMVVPYLSTPTFVPLDSLAFSCSFSGTEMVLNLSVVVVVVVINFQGLVEELQELPIIHSNAITEHRHDQM